MALLVTCPCCNESFNLREARTDEQWREMITLLTMLPRDVQVGLWQYFELFKPAKQASVRSGTLLKLMKELLPLIKAQQIRRKRTTYTVHAETWGKAMVYLYERRNALQLPLKGNGYLLETLASNAEKKEAKAEQAQIVKTRNAFKKSDGKLTKGSTIAKQVASNARQASEQVKDDLPEISTKQRKANFKRLGTMLDDAMKGKDVTKEFENVSLNSTNDSNNN